MTSARAAREAAFYEVKLGLTGAVLGGEFREFGGGCSASCCAR
ncbi:MAG: hypothetical protein ACRD0K_17435 [Egibacteraceae bacterium]